MDLLQLKYFQTIARTEHISKAAAELCIAQPSLSQTLKRLESEVGMQLFDRVGKRIILNEAGQIYLKYIDHIFLDLENAARELDSYRDVESKTVKILIQSASFLLPNILNQIHVFDKSIQLHIQQHYGTNELSTAWDLCISSSSTKPSADSTVTLMKECLGVALPQNHPLTHKDFLVLDDLKEEPFLALSPDSRLTLILNSCFEQIRFCPHIVTSVDSPNILRDLLRMNLGLAFIPELTWNNFAAESIVFRTIQDFPMQRYITLSWPADKYMTRSTCICKEAIIKYFTRYSSQYQE